MRSPEKEMGVFPITLIKTGMTDPLLPGLPPNFPVIHWHNDMPDLPENSTVLVHSLGCPRRIIRFKDLEDRVRFNI